MKLKVDGWLIGLVIGGFLLLIGAILAAGASPLAVTKSLVDGAFGSAPKFTDTLRETTPLLIAGVAVFFALRAGLFNIGVEGQLVVGAMVCAVVALKFPGPLGVVLGIVAAIVAGALWALPAGLIKAYRNGHEVITTIMLNNVALFFTSALVSGPIKDPGSADTSTAMVSPATRIPGFTIGHLTVNLSLIVGLAIAAIVGTWLRKTIAGYELRATGANASAARFAGVDTKQVVLRAMLVSGAIAGFAGACQVLAFEGRFYSGFSPGYGFDALGVALLAGGNALALAPAALLFGALAKGGTMIQLEGVPKGITTVILGVLILIAAAIRYRKEGRVA